MLRGRGISGAVSWVRLAREGFPAQSGVDQIEEGQAFLGVEKGRGAADT